MRPDLGEIEDVVAELLSLVGSHGLLMEIDTLIAKVRLRVERETHDVDGPGRVIATLNGLEQLLCTIVWVLSSQASSGRIIHSLFIDVRDQTNDLRRSGFD